MARYNFTKMHGIGNDYIYFDCLKAPVTNPEDLARKLSDRHFSIGGDGIVLIMPSEKSDFRMRMFNADGSESQMCGNAVRCVAKYVYERGHTSSKRISLETKAGEKILNVTESNGIVSSVKVDMGEPILEAARIPLAGFTNSPVTDATIEINGETFKFTAVSMGNPHAVIFVDQITDHLVHVIGPKIEVHPFFPERVNVEFAKVISRDRIEMRVWERGSGETLACGTGACAVTVAASLTNRADRSVTMSLLGGELAIEWAADGHVYKTGPATIAFDGVVEV